MPGAEHSGLWQHAEADSRYLSRRENGPLTLRHPAALLAAAAQPHAGAVLTLYGMNFA